MPSRLQKYVVFPLIQRNDALIKLFECYCAFGVIHRRREALHCYIILVHGAPDYRCPLFKTKLKAYQWLSFVVNEFKQTFKWKNFRPRSYSMIHADEKFPI